MVGSGGPSRGLPGDRDIDLNDLPSTSAGSPAPAPRRTTGRAVSNAKPAKDYLPFIDVAIDESALYSEYGLMLQDRYTRIQIVTLKPDAYDIEGVSSGTRKEPVDTRNYNKESRNWLSRMMGSQAGHQGDQGAVLGDLLVRQQGGRVLDDE